MNEAERSIGRCLIAAANEKWFPQREEIPAPEAAERLNFLSFRGTPRAEESLISLTLELREIPHFVRNDKITYFFRSLGSHWLLQILGAPREVYLS